MYTVFVSFPSHSGIVVVIVVTVVVVVIVDAPT